MVGGTEGGVEGEGGCGDGDGDGGDCWGVRFSLELEMRCESLSLF